MMVAEDLQSNPKYVTDGINSAKINKHYKTVHCRLCESLEKCYLFKDETIKIYICESCYNWLKQKMEKRDTLEKKIEELEDY